MTRPVVMWATYWDPESGSVDVEEAIVEVAHSPADISWTKDRSIEPALTKEDCLVVVL